MAEKTQSTLKGRQTVSLVKWAFLDRTCDGLFVHCKKCNHLVMMEGYRPVFCNTCRVKVYGPEIPCVVEISYICGKCGRTTKLSQISLINFFICVYCYFKPEFGYQDCYVMIEPVQDKLFNIPFAPIKSRKRRQQENYLTDFTRLSDFPYTTPNVFFPSQSISPIMFRGYLWRKIPTLWTDLACCTQCREWMEFEWVRESVCISCNFKFDTSDFVEHENHYTAEARLLMKCNRCEKESVLPTWSESGILKCPLCFNQPKVGNKLDIRRQLRTFEDDEGRIFRAKHHKVIWTWTVDRVSEHEHSQEREITSHDREINQLKRKYSEPSTCANTSTRTTLAPLQVAPAETSAAQFTRVEEKLKSEIPIVTFDVEAVTIRYDDSPGVKPVHEQRAVLVSVYGDGSKKGDRKVLMDCIWLKSPFMVNNGQPIFHFEQVKSNGITREIYKYNTARGKPIGLFKQEFLQICEDKIVFCHGEGDLKMLGLSEFTGRNITWINTANVFEHEYIPGNPAPVSLKNLLKIYLDRDIQSGSHSPTEDAKALYDLVMKTMVAHGKIYYYISEVPPKIKYKPSIRCYCPFNKFCFCPCKVTYNPSIFECTCTCCLCNFVGGQRRSEKTITNHDEWKQLFKLFQK